MKVYKNSTKIQAVHTLGTSVQLSTKTFAMIPKHLMYVAT